MATAIALWGVVGVLALLVRALWRLTPIALEPLLERQLSAAQALMYLAWVLFNAWAEGYRGFHKRFSPRVVARAVHLGDHPRALHVILAPAFCMAFFHATRRAKILAWGVLLMIVVVVTVVQRVPQPWRGIIDGGVVVGLAWGVLAIVYFFVRALTGRAVSASLELPDS